MDATDQVIFLLKLAVNLGPVAGYFIVLGLVNSQARPILIRWRSDFVILTLVFAPLLFWPIPRLAAAGMWWALILGMGLAVGLFRMLLPRPDGGWVVYNLSRVQFVRVTGRVLRALGLRGDWADKTLVIEKLRLRLDVSVMPIFRSVSIRLSSLDGPGTAPPQSEELRTALEREFAKQAQLPSLAGACLVVAGLSILILPLWMMARHMNAIVEVVQSWGVG